MESIRELFLHKEFTQEGFISEAARQPEGWIPE
jgi:hypothetical protein